MADGGGRTGFLHGVASFDPLPDSVVIWSRLKPLRRDEVVPVGWEVSARPDFSDVVASGEVTTDESRDWTVAVDVKGLQPAQRYHYRFVSGKLRSVSGITKTAPAGPTDELFFATVCCSNWAWGCFHVYDLVSKVDNLDFVLHCGDYIYEYPKREYPSAKFMARHGLRPKHWCTSLQDYRERYACCRTDPALQELHRRVPFIACWDDHEVMDDSSKKDAADFNGSQKEWEERKRAGVKAFIEWVPIRGASHEKIDLAACHRTFSFGDLATLLLVENRISNRTPPVDLTRTEFYHQTAYKKVKEWNEEAIHAAAADLRRQLADPSRNNIGEEQLRDVAEDVRESVAAGRPWQVFVSQTVLSEIHAPKLLETVRLQPRMLSWICRKALKTATSVKRAGKEAAEMARMYLGMGKTGTPMNPGAYDGYTAERDKLLRALAIEGSNPVVLAGDSHNAWAHDIIDRNGNRLGVEFDAPGVTSIGAFEDIHSRFVMQAGQLARLFPLWLFTPWIEDALAAANPDTLKFSNLDHRGCLLHHVTHAKFHTEYQFVSDVRKKTYHSFCGAVFEAAAGFRGQLKKGVRYLTIEGEIPVVKKPKRSALLRSSRNVSKRTAQYW